MIFLPDIANESSNAFIQTIYHDDFQIGYIFVSSLIASLVTLLFVLPIISKSNGSLMLTCGKKMMKYGLPILVAGIVFAINEHFDKILLDWMDVDMADIGAYSACYKIGMFMVLFRTAYTLGIEPFFFSHAKMKMRLKPTLRLPSILSFWFVYLLRRYRFCRYFEIDFGAEKKHIGMRWMSCH